jgi:nucleotide-binding universal stress UspA family protein
MSSGRLLLGYDGSPQADHAIAVAGALLPGAEAIVAHAWHAPWPSHEELSEILREREGTTPDDLSGALREMGQAQADATVGAGVERAREAGLQATPLTRESQQGVWFELAALGRELGARLIVTGAGGVGEQPLGRVADATVRLAEQPVLVVRPKSPVPSQDAPLVLGYDGSDHAALAIEQAGRLLAGRRAIVVHVGHMDSAEQGARLASAAGFAAEPRTEPAAARGVVRPEGAAWHRLAAVAQETGAAAIVVGQSGAGAVRRFLLGSVAGGLLRHADHPVLVVPRVDA